MKNLFFAVTLLGLVALIAAGIFEISARAARTNIAALASSLAAPPPSPSEKNGALVVRVAWLAERESAMGDWEAVRPPLRAGDELQLTVRADDDAWVYVLADSDGVRRQIFPAPHEPSSLARVRGGWQYALPGRALTWRLDGGAHDRFVVVAARAPLADPLAALAHASPAARTPARDLELPLRDGRTGLAAAFTLSSPEILVDEFTAR